MSRDLYSRVARLEREWMDGWCKNRIETCEELMADDFVFVSGRGALMGKPQWIAAARTYMKCEEFAWEDLRVRPYGRLVIVHGRATQRARDNDEDRSGVVILTDVWLVVEGQWRVNTRHVCGPA